MSSGLDPIISTDGETPSSSQPKQENSTPKVHKTFRELKSYTSKLAEFALQWQDLEDHFLSITTQLHELEKIQSFHSLGENAHTQFKDDRQDSIFVEKLEGQCSFESKNENQEGKINCVSEREGIRNENPETEMDYELKGDCFQANNGDPDGKFGGSERNLIDNENPVCEIGCDLGGASFEAKKEEPEQSVEEMNGESMKGCPFPLGCGKELVLYLNGHIKDKEREALSDDLCKYLKGVANPGKLVLEALRLFVPMVCGNSKMTKKTSNSRKSCVLLLEAVVKMGPLVVRDKDREDATRMALNWKGKVVTGHHVDPFGVWVFLMFVAVFGLVTELDEDDLFACFDHVVQRSLAPEVFRALGFANKAHGNFLVNYCF